MNSGVINKRQLHQSRTMNNDKMNLMKLFLAAALTFASTIAFAAAPPYQRMDYGPALFWTLQVAPGNIAQKGIAIRLDDGPGGVSKGRAWMVYDHDTMRVAAATTGDFVDWKGIAFDGSHGTHTSLSGERHFVNPVGPGWASPHSSSSRPLPSPLRRPIGAWTSGRRCFGRCKSRRATSRRRALRFASMTDPVA